MTHEHRRRGIFSYVLIPVVLALFLFGIFSIVWLRSSVRTIEYSIASFDDKRTGLLNERKMLMAERASLLSIQNVKDMGNEKIGLIFPERTKVIYVKREGGSFPYRTSLEGRNLSEP